MHQASTRPFKNSYQDLVCSGLNETDSHRLMYLPTLSLVGELFGRISRYVLAGRGMSLLVEVCPCWQKYATWDAL